MRRKLFSFLGLLAGLYVGLGLLLHGVENHEKHLADLDGRAPDALILQDTPLIQAVNRHDAHAVAQLLESGADPNGADRGLRTPLLIAAREGDLATVEKLVTAGARIDLQDKTGMTALLYAIKAGRNPDVTTYLLAHGADVGHRDYTGETPLLIASNTADTRLIEALLARGADANVLDRIGLTPLMRVARSMAAERTRRNFQSDPTHQYRAAMELLLQYGADVRIRDREGWTALLYASENEPSEGLQTLLKHGADPHIAVKGRTPLRNAASRGLVGNLQALLNTEATPDKDTLSDALMQAVLTGHDSAAQFLLDHGADANYCDQYGLTPLMLAIANDHLSTARLLVLYGANARVRDLLGKSALDYAQPGQNEAIRAEVFGGRGFRRF